MPEIVIDKTIFDKYVRVQKSRLLNMFDVNNVMKLSGLTKDECFEIIVNYNHYQEAFGKKRFD